MREGAVVNDFEAVDQLGQPRRLYDLLEAGPIVLFFYQSSYPWLNEAKLPLSRPQRRIPKK